jgi:hypothetical protein
VDLKGGVEDDTSDLIFVHNHRALQFLAARLKPFLGDLGELPMNQAGGSVIFGGFQARSSAQSPPFPRGPVLCVRKFRPHCGARGTLRGNASRQGRVRRRSEASAFARCGYGVTGWRDEKAAKRERKGLAELEPRIARIFTDWEERPPQREPAGILAIPQFGVLLALFRVSAIFKDFVGSRPPFQPLYG